MGTYKAVGTILNTETPVLTGFTLVNAETGSDIGAIDDGGVLTLDDPANGSFGVRAERATGAEIGSVLLELSGAKTVTRTDNLAPYSLYGDANGQAQGEGLPAGSYTLRATAYNEANLQGDELYTLEVAFTVLASAEVEETEEPAALTASFVSTPSEHAGPGERFTFELTFSEETPTSYKTLRDHSFSITGGHVRKAKRRQQGSNIGWQITVEPSGWGAIAISLPGGRACTTSGAICTADNRQLSNSPSATVQGPAALSVADANAHENSDATLDFAVSLNRASTLTVTVDYATSNGTATAGSDYTATSDTLTFEPGDVSKTVSVPILDDGHDDGEETLTLTLSNASGARIADGTATGTIVNSDPIPQAWLARFGRTVSGQVLDAVEERLRASRTAGVSVSLAGQTIGLTAQPDAKADSETEADKESQARLGVLSDWLRQDTVDRRAGRDTVADHDGARGADGIVLRAGREDGRRRHGRGLGPDGAVELLGPRGRAQPRRRRDHGAAGRGLCAGSLDRRRGAVAQQRRRRL